MVTVDQNGEQRPEFLGSFTKMVNVNPIAQTSATDNTSPQGNLSAYGVTAARFHGFTKSFVEHGYILGFVCARADLTYQQGINKMWLRSTVYDFYWPTFAHLGEQAIELREIYAQGSKDDTTVFGYQERYGDYRDWETDRKSTRLNSSHITRSRMPSSA